MYYDELPVWIYVGMKDPNDERKVHLFTHIHFDIAWNAENVIGLNVSTDPNTVVELLPNMEITVDFTYSAKWIETDITFDHRLDKYSMYSKLPQHLEVNLISNYL